MMKKVILAAAALAVSLSGHAQRYVGGDISLLPEYEKAGAQYKDHDGTPLASLLPFLKEEGMNAMRVRVFVNPDDYTGRDKDPNACQDMEYILPLCRQIKDNGFALMLDFHYSDTWADPAKQWTPAAWANLSDSELAEMVYDYTRESLLTLKNEGIMPDFIQTGNEISYGMLWGEQDAPDDTLKKTFLGNEENWGRLGDLLQHAVAACRDVCPEAKIVLHTERVADIQVLDNFYYQMNLLDVDYDIIGLSYYPYFHGNLTQLDKALSSLEQFFPTKNIMIAETGFPYKWEVPGTSVKVDYPYSDAGQNEFAKDLVALLLNHGNVNGLFWWWMEYNAYGTSLSGWYNAPLFDSTTGRATSALKTICSFASSAGVESDCAPDDDDATRWHDLSGRLIDNPGIPGIYLRGSHKIIIR